MHYLNGALLFTVNMLATNALQFPETIPFHSTFVCIAFFPSYLSSSATIHVAFADCPSPSKKNLKYMAVFTWVLNHLDHVHLQFHLQLIAAILQMFMADNLQ